MIHFETIRYKNLLSTGNVWTEIVLDKSPTTLIIGINGAGKSTLLDALTFVLFGKSFRGSNIPLLINSVNEKELLVEVKFRIGNRKYKIERGVKPNIFNIYCNDVLINQDSTKKDYQKVLENQILKMNYKAFTQIVILGTSSFVPFMQLPALDRRVIIEDLLDIEIFSSMNKVVKGHLDSIIQELNSSKLSLDSTLAKIDLQRKYVEEAKRNSVAILEDAKKEYEDNRQQVTKLLDDAKLVQNHVDFLMKAVADESALNEQRDNLRGFYVKINSKKKVSERHFKFYSENDNCPTCEQQIDPGFKAKAIGKANNLIQEYNDAIGKIDDKIIGITSRLEALSELHSKISTHQLELVRINASVAQIQKHMVVLQEEIKELETKKVLSDDMMKVSEELMRELKTLNDRRTDLSESKKYYDVAATLLKDNGIKTKIIRQYLPVINKLVNKYLAAMDFFVSFEINEEFKETIKSRYRDGFKYENFSEGERMKIDLSLMFTWRTIAKLKNSMNTNLLILDEVFDSSLDTGGTEEILKLLNALGADTNVFLISHKGDILIDKFSHIIRFEKRGNFSEIVE